MPKNLKKENQKIIEITSPSNTRIKDVVRLLRDGSLRHKDGVVIVDGQREMEEALKNNWIVEEFFYCEDFFKNKNSLFLAEKIIQRAQTCYRLPKKVFEKISYKKTPDGFLGVLPSQIINFKDIKIKKNPLVLILESIEKPGNLGGIIRTAYASGVDLIILNDQKTDLYSPNVIRSSTGFIFSMPIVISPVKQTIKWLNDNNINILITSVDADKKHFSANFKSGTAIVFGTEALGISENWRGVSLDKIKIPMISGVDSLNVSVSVGIVVYEAIRQRKVF